MPRPCYKEHEDPKKFVKVCRICELYVTNAEYRSFFDSLPTKSENVRPKRVSLCLHRGARITPPVAPDNTRDWVHCEKGHGMVCSCHSCNPSCRDYSPEDPDQLPIIHVKTSGMGIGDAVSQFQACCGLAQKGYDVVMKSRHDKGWFKWASFPNVEIVDNDESGIDCNINYAGQLHSAAGGVCPHRADWYCAAIADFMGIPLFEPARPNTVKPPPFFGAFDPPYCVIAPFSLSESRQWPIQKIQELTSKLIENGLHARIIGESKDGQRLADYFGSTYATWHYGHSPEDTVRIIANAQAFVGIDSGMTHIAGLYGVQGVAIMTHLHSSFVFGKMAPTITGVSASGWGCQGCAWSRPCPTHKTGQCGALQAIPSSDVAEKILNPVNCDSRALATRYGGVRRESLLYALNLLDERFASPNVVETGCIRSPDDWSAGYFTYLMGLHLKQRGAGRLISVDNDHKHLEIARRLTAPFRPHVDLFYNNSTDYLQGLKSQGQKMDLIYLDSLDTDQPGSAEHGLIEAQLAESVLSENGFLLIDDSPTVNGVRTGKGALSIPYLLGRGWKIRAGDYQVVLTR